MPNAFDLPFEQKRSLTEGALGGAPRIYDQISGRLV